MTGETHAARRDAEGFLIRRFPKRAEGASVLWMAIAMVGFWLGACALSLAVGFSWIG